MRMVSRKRRRNRSIVFRAAAGWLGQIQLQPMISHRFGLAELAEAFAIARAGTGCKVLVYPGR